MNYSLPKIVSLIILIVGNFLHLQAQNPADVSGAIILCSKETRTVANIAGCGDDCNETITTCLGDGTNGDVETNSIWFNFRATNFGVLTFVIEALDPNDQLSFAVVQLPNGFNDGTDMVTLRCVPTCTFNRIGLNDTAFDVSEDPACPPTNDGFLEGLNLEAGLSYGILINNANSTGGFTIEFGGTGELEGPSAVVTPDNATVCFGQTVTFENNSSFDDGTIVEYEWDFGPDVLGEQIITTPTPNPQTVNYTTPGAKNVTLTIRTNLDCEARTVFENIVTIDDCCDSDNQISIGDNPIISEVACPGDVNGAIDIQVTSPPNFPPTIEWSTGENTEDIAGLGPGEYSVTVSNAATCRDSFTVELIPPNTLTAVEVVTPPSCGGLSDGMIVVQATGGRMPYAYNWDDGNGFISDGTLTDLPIGDYSVTVQDATGCTFPIEGIELDEKELIVEIVNQNDPNCQGGTDGRITLNISNGIAPFQYDFNDGLGLVGEPVLSQLAAGDYILDVFDAEQCQGTIDFLLNEPEELRLNIEPGRISCNGAADGALIAIPAGGTPDYTFAWSTGTTTRTIDELVAGDYTLTVTDANGCTIEQTVTLDEPELLEATITNILDVECPGQGNGSIDLDIQGGISPYQFSLDGLNFNNFDNGTTLTGLEAGEYQITIEDNNACSVVVEATINSPATLSIDVNQVANICYGESITFTDASIFTRGQIVAWEWDFGDGATPATATDAGPHQIVYTSIGQPIVTLTLRTDLNCEVTFSDTLAIQVESCCDREENSVTAAGFGEPPACTGESSGAISLFPISTPPITSIIWNDALLTGEILEDLPAGEYTVSITNEAECEATNTFVLEDPEPLTATLSLESPTCEAAFNGGITAMATGGTGFLYEYDFGNGFSDINTFSDLNTGNYSVTIQDENFCQLVIDTVLQVPDGFEAIIASLGTINPTCAEAANGEITVNLTDNRVYDFDFGNGFTNASILQDIPIGDYSVVIRDADNCTLQLDTNLFIPSGQEAIGATLNIVTPSCEEALNGVVVVNAIDLIGSNINTFEYDFGSGFTTTNSVDNLGVGALSVTIRDADNCTLMIDTSLSVSPDAMPVSLSLNITNPSCGGLTDGSITVLPSGESGTDPANYEYDFGNGFVPNNINAGLGNGSFSITVRNENNCTSSLDTVLSELTLAPDLPTITEPSCFGFSDGNIAFIVPNGIGPFLYDLQDGNGFQPEGVINNLPEGTYNIQVQDADLCLSELVEVVVNQPTALTITTDAIDISCFGENDGSIMANVSGGVGGYTYTWSDGQTTRTADNLPPGDYTVNVLDANNCVIEDANAIIEPTELSIAVADVSNALCFGEANGSISVNAMGGSMPFSFSLDGVLFQSSSTLEGLVAGDYSVTVRDNRNCETATEVVSVAEPAEFSITAEVDRDIANLGFPVNLSASASAGNVGVNYVWSTPDAVICNNCPSVETVPPGSTTFTVVGINADNCTATASVSVLVSLDRPVYIPNAFSPNGDGNNDTFFIPFSPSMSRIDRLQIYDRAGSLVFEATDIERGEAESRAWDGRFNGSNLRYGVFVIAADISFVDGQTLEFHSDLTLFGEE